MAGEVHYQFSELADNPAIQAEFLGYSDGLVRSSPGDWVLLPTTAALVPQYQAMEVRQDDVWIVTYPKVRDWSSSVANKP